MRRSSEVGNSPSFESSAKSPNPDPSQAGQPASSQQASGSRERQDTCWTQAMKGAIDNFGSRNLPYRVSLPPFNSWASGEPGWLEKGFSVGDGNPRDRNGRLGLTA